MDKAIYQNIYNWRLAEALLLMANWKNSEIITRNGEKLIIKRGQLITGREELARKTGLGSQSIRTSLKHLEKLEFLTINSTKHYTVITICNYDSYQDINNLPNQHSNHDLTRTQPGPNQDLTTYEQDKQDKQRKKDQPLLHTPEQIPEVVVVEETKSIIQKDKERHLGKPINTPEQLIEFWYSILNCFGIKKIDDLFGNAGKVDWAASNDIINLRKVELDELKAIIWDLAIEKFLDVRSKHNYVKKTNISNVFTSLSYVCRCLRSSGVVGYPSKSVDKSNSIF